MEPFAGSLAVLLGRPHAPRTETVNDLDRYIANFWRAVKHAPEVVAHYADWPVNEVDLRARHDWLVTLGRDRLSRLDDDPEDYDPKIAGWWVWGLCCWIGSGWCPDKTARGILGNAGRGVNRQLPHLGDAGQGVNRKLPHLGDAGRGVNHGLLEWIGKLADRFSRVRVCSGEWRRVCGPSVTFKHGTTGVLLDPPYSMEERGTLYAQDSGSVAAEVREWAIENGDNDQLRIALCGYEGEHDMPKGWAEVEWKARGGYGSQGDAQGRENAHRERIWFSPHCIQPANARGLFDSLEA